MDYREAERLGAKKYYENPNEYRNPFSSGRPEHDAFERGWVQALKKSGVCGGARGHIGF